jgi:M6 family metalloprotease-like protein
MRTSRTSLGTASEAISTHLTCARWRPARTVVRVLAFSWLLSLTTAPLAGMIASPHPVEVEQPDGRKVILHARGDERSHWFEDADGYTVVRDHGIYSYARLDAHGRLSPSAWKPGTHDPRAYGLEPRLSPAPKALKAQRAETLVEASGGQGQPARGMTAGCVKNLVVLCRFSDHALGVKTRSRADYDMLFNAFKGHPILAPTGSVRDYYEEVSYGALMLESTVVGWVTLPHSESYYAHGSDGLNNAYPRNAQGMVEDALKLVDPLINFADFDSDDDGYIDTITIIHSGYGAETGGGGGNWIWSHRWSLGAVPGGAWSSADHNRLGNAVKVYDYHTEPALWGASGSIISRIGVICHELGHFFGLPDLYDTDGSSSGAGSWCLMANSWGFDGSQLHPPHPCAWARIQLGWAEAVTIVPGCHALPPVATSSAIYRVDRGYPSGEYLLLENRQPLGFESDMGQGGLAIWHIDERKNDNDEEGYPGQSGWPGNNQHYRVALLQADGRFDLECGRNRGDAGDLYVPAMRSALGSDTVPNSNAYQNGQVVSAGNRILITQASAGIVSWTYSNPIWIDIALGEALDALTLPWLTTGDSPWIGQAGTTWDGQEAAASGSILDGQASHLQTELVGPGQLRFLWKVSSELNYDYLRLTLDGKEVGAISGETDWAEYSLLIPGGLHRLAWSYVKDSVLTGGQDRGWLDQVHFEAAMPALKLLPPRHQPDGGLTIVVQRADGLPLTAELAERITVQCADDIGGSGSIWRTISESALLTNGCLATPARGASTSAHRFFRAIAR